MKEVPIVRFFVERFALATSIFLALVLFGVVSTIGRGVDLFPSFELPIVAVFTTYPGAGPEEVVEEISKPIENALSTLPGISDISSFNMESVGFVVAQFAQGTDIDIAANEVGQRVASVAPQLPETANAPSVQKFNPQDQPILSIALSATGVSLEDIADYADDALVPQLKRLGGVADVGAVGAPAREVQVLVQPPLLEAYGVTVDQVVQTIQASALNIPAGSLDVAGERLTLAIRNTPASADQVAAILVDPVRGLKVGDLATVRLGTADATTYARLNGEPVVLYEVRKASGANSVSAARNVRDFIKDFNFPEGYQVQITRDTTTFTEATVNDTFFEAILTAIVVSIVVLLFLGRLNTVFSVILAIPITLAGAVAVYGLLDFTFNTISLLSLIVAVGIVVDDSIVVAENTDRYLEEGHPLKDAVIKGASEVSMAVAAATLSLLAVFIPISFLPGIIGQFFREFSVGLAASVFFSWVEALFFLTVRMAYFPDPKVPSGKDLGAMATKLPQDFLWGLKPRSWITPGSLTMLFLIGGLLYWQLGSGGLVGLLAFPLVLGILEYVWRLAYNALAYICYWLYQRADTVLSAVRDGYSTALVSALNNTGTTILIALLLFLSSIFIVTRIPFNFIPQFDAGFFQAQLDLTPGTTLYETNTASILAEDAILRLPGIKQVTTSVGGSTIMPGLSNPEQATIEIELVPRNQRELSQKQLEQESEKAIREALSGYPEVEVRVGGGGPAAFAQYDVQFNLVAQNNAVLRERNTQAMDVIENIPWVQSVNSSLDATAIERIFQPDPALLSGTGLTVAQIATALRTYNTGEEAGRVRNRGDEYPIMVRADPNYLVDEESLLSLPVYSPVLQSNLPIASLGGFALSEAPLTIFRTNQAYSSGVNITLGPGAPGGFQAQAEIESELKKASVVGTDASIETVGQASFLGDLVFYGIVAFAVAIVLNYMVIASQFNSFRYPIYLLLSIPLALVGAFWLVFFFGTGLDVISILGTIMLIGLVTKNAILRLDLAVERAEHMPLRQALMEAAKIRFRPIVMTTLTILFISLPLILGLGEGAEFRRGLGIVILGGVFSSALLTLFVVPAAFLRFEGPRYAKAEAAKRAEAQRERFNYPDGRPSQAGED